MNKEDIIRIAKDGGISLENAIYRDVVLAVAALVAAEKEQQMIRDGYRRCAEGQRTTQYCGLLDSAVAAEREACAKVCDGWSKRDDDVGGFIGRAIRARGET